MLKKASGATVNACSRSCYGDGLSVPAFSLRHRHLPCLGDPRQSGKRDYINTPDLTLLTLGSDTYTWQQTHHGSDRVVL
jgi:hypothetical protein